MVRAAAAVPWFHVQAEQQATPVDGAQQQLGLPVDCGAPPQLDLPGLGADGGQDDDELQPPRLNRSSVICAVVDGSAATGGRRRAGSHRSCIVVRCWSQSVRPAPVSGVYIIRITYCDPLRYDRRRHAEISQHWREPESCFYGAHFLLRGLDVAQRRMRHGLSRAALCRQPVDVDFAQQRGATVMQLAVPFDDESVGRRVVRAVPGRPRRAPDLTADVAELRRNTRGPARVDSWGARCCAAGFRNDLRAASRGPYRSPPLGQVVVRSPSRAEYPSQLELGRVRGWAG